MLYIQSSLLNVLRIHKYGAELVLTEENLFGVQSAAGLNSTSDMILGIQKNYP